MKKYALLALMIFGIVCSVSYVYWYHSRKVQTSITNINPIDQVFNVTATKKNESNIVFSFVIAPGVYIYKQRLKITTTPGDELYLSHITWPATLSIPDIENPEKNEEVFIQIYGIPPLKIFGPKKVTKSP